MRVVNTVRVVQMGRGARLAHAERTAHAVNMVNVARMVCVGLAALVALKARPGDVERLVKRAAPERRAARVWRTKSACLKSWRHSSTMSISNSAFR